MTSNYYYDNAAYTFKGKPTPIWAENIKPLLNLTQKSFISKHMLDMFVAQRYNSVNQSSRSDTMPLSARNTKAAAEELQPAKHHVCLLHLPQVRWSYEL